MTEQRIRFRDVKPYERVDALEDLRGPAAGEVTLPVEVYWSGTRSTFDIGDPRERRVVYQAALSNGMRKDIVALVNRELLVQDWHRLALDRRIVDLWVERFPELTTHGAAS